MDRPVALKIPNFSGTLTEAQKQRFFREARAIAALRHPNICPVYDADEEQGVLYLTMHYIDGQPLSASVDHGPMGPEKAIAIVRRLAQAMQVAHTHGTIHRDLKPANIMIDRSGEPVIMDFGLARRTHWVLEESRHPTATPAGDQGLTQHGSVLGTPAYMPPEQARGDIAAIGPRCDIYSLGVILYELLTGRRPFAADDTPELIRQIENDPPPKPTDFYPWVDKGLEAACLKALAKDPADRFQTMAEFERALKDVVEPELKVMVPPPLPRRAKPRRKKRWWVKPVEYLAVALFFLTVCVGGPTAAIYMLIERASEKFKGIIDHQGEWNTIASNWDAPAADAAQEVLLPPTFDDGRYRLRTVDKAPTDADLGITLTGVRGVYDGPDGQVEVRFYRCPEAQAKAIQQKAYSYAQSRLNRPTVANPGGPKRKAVVYSSQSSSLRTVTFGFRDEYSDDQEYGTLWYGGGWLYWFRSGDSMSIESFPPKFLKEVGKAATGPKK
jgi:hypothetical protein